MYCVPCLDTWNLITLHSVYLEIKLPTLGYVIRTKQLSQVNQIKFSFITQSPSMGLQRSKWSPLGIHWEFRCKLRWNSVIGKCHVCNYQHTCSFLQNFHLLKQSVHQRGVWPLGDYSLQNITCKMKIFNTMLPLVKF